MPKPRIAIVTDSQFATCLADSKVTFVPSDGDFHRGRLHQDKTWDTGERVLEEHLIYVIRRGSCLVTWNQPQNGKVILRSGNGILIPPGVGFRCRANQKSNILMARFRLRIARQSQRIVWNSLPRIFPMDATRERLVDILTDEIPRGDGVLLHNLAKTFCSALLRQDIPQAGLSLDQIATLTQAIHQHPYTITPHDLARKLGLGLDWATRLIRRATGYPPRTWIVHERIRLACTLMDDGHSPNQVASDLGYTDLRLFGRQFRSVTGYPPSTWAKRTRRE